METVTPEIVNPNAANNTAVFSTPRASIELKTTPIVFFVAGVFVGVAGVWLIKRYM